MVRRTSVTTYRVSGKTHEEHDQNLRTVFQRLREKGLTLNKSKCEYSKDRLEFFGYVFSKDGISPDPKKVEDVVNLHTPSTASEVHSLLGMTNYCSRFIPEYATKTKPLRKLTPTRTNRGVEQQSTTVQLAS